jgi:hypothetical protein
MEEIPFHLKIGRALLCGMVWLRAKVLGRLGRTENSPSRSVCSILPLARHFRAGRPQRS